ncbi:hypothetical protein DPV78_001918 [Talaromyces pinophilus]|nr:hypothetical protein DPV78_001918 [Talaromyces pinophilus]
MPLFLVGAKVNHHSSHNESSSSWPACPALARLSSAKLSGPLYRKQQVDSSLIGGLEHRSFPKRP